MSHASEVTAHTEVRDGMRITWHQPIHMTDGLVLRADVYRPVDDGRYPVTLTYGIYAKGLAYQDGYPLQWEKMIADHPEILKGSTNAYQNWETTDPERWVPHGYAAAGSPTCCCRSSRPGAGARRRQRELRPGPPRFPAA